MKNSAIRQMFDNERGASSDIPSTEEEDDLVRKAMNLEIQLREKMAGNDELIALYEKTFDAFEDVHSESAFNHYAEGFRFGVLMGLDVVKA